MELPSVIIPQFVSNETFPDQNSVNSIKEFNQIVNLKDNSDCRIINYSIDWTFDDSDFPEIEKELNKCLVPFIYRLKLYFYYVDKNFRPFPVVYNSDTPITSTNILKFIVEIYETPLNSGNLEFYRLYDSDYSYLDETSKLKDVMKYCYFQNLEVYKDGFIVNIFD